VGVIKCERPPSEEEQALADMAAELRAEVRKAQASLKAGLAEADSVLRELRVKRNGASQHA
jgi:hypothetical protein